MLLHSDIIEKLTQKQKVALLSNIASFSDPEFNKLGVPHVTITTLKEIADGLTEDIYPSFESIANSWNPDLFKRISMDICAREQGDKSNLVKIPAAKTKTNVYTRGLTEDQYLAGLLAGGFLEGVNSSGRLSCMTGFHLERSDVEYLDTTADKRALYNMFISPYIIALQKGKSYAVSVSGEEFNNGYEDINRGFFHKRVQNVFPDIPVLCDKMPFDYTVPGIMQGDICVTGFAAAIDLALATYRKIKQSIEEGSASVEELEEAIADGRAISAEMLDIAVDRVLDFATQCNETLVPYDASDEQPQVTVTCAKDAARRAVVLLKNKDNLLPVKGRKKVAVIGHLATISDNRGIATVDDILTQGAASYACEYLGCSDGYDIDRDRNEDLIAQAVELAKRADLVLLYLGTNAKREKDIYREHNLKLPANQLAVADALKVYGKKTVVVLTSNYQTDMSFDSDFSAVVLAPVGGTHAGDAVLDAVFGRYNPSGRLARTLYDDTDEFFATLKKYKNHGRNKVGTFIGYKYYDSSKLPVKYPFGFGLSYTTFNISDFSAAQGQVRFTVENTGKVTGQQNIQIYIGKNDSAYIGADKELKAFVLIGLKPGEKRKVSVKLVNLSTFNDDYTTTVMQGGKYKVYVATSISEVVLSGEMDVAGETLPKHTEKKYEYLQAVSNIIDGKFTMEGKRKNMKNDITVRNVGIAMIVIAALLDVIFGLFNYIFSSTMLFIVVMVAVNLMLATGIGMVTTTVTKIKRIKEHNTRIDTEADNFAGTPIIRADAIEDLFAEEFDDEEILDLNERAIETDAAMYVDKDATMEEACARFVTFAEDRGISIDIETSRSIMAATAASHLMILRCDAEMYRPFISVLSDYFGNGAYSDDVDESYASVTDLLFRDNGDKEMDEKQFATAIHTAENARHVAVFAGLNGVKYSTVESYFSPIIRFISNPSRECRVAVKDKLADKVYTMPSNLWIIMRPDEGETVDEIPTFLADMASYVDLRAGACAEAAEPAQIERLNYHQFEYLCTVCKREYEISEDMWKKVDRVENSVNTFAPYHIGNRLWLRIEKYTAVYLASGGSDAEALDSVVASKLLPVVLPVILNKSEEGTEGLVTSLALIFGEENIEQCKKTISCAAQRLYD